MAKRLFIFLLLVSGCANHAGKGKKYQISGTIQVEVPDCSGNGTSGKRPLSNAVYYIKEASTNDPDVIATEQLRADANGNFRIKLPAGTYSLVHADKLLSFAEFKGKHSSKSNYFQNLDEDCFLNWYRAPDFLLVVKESMQVNWVVKSRCYTEQNPCVKYTGVR